MRPGAHYLGDGRTRFIVWAPFRSRVDLKLLGPPESVLRMERAKDGYFEAVAEAAPGARYLYVLDGEMERPDPASHFQPDGVHRPSAVVDHGAFRWEDGSWRGVPLEDYIIYELHVGAYTAGGTFQDIIPRIPYLKDLGVTAVEIMPVAQFPGWRNWGYDGVHPYAVQNSYGGPDGLKRLVNALHGAGLAVVMDVVYNHLGPEGNYLRDFGPYFTDRYRTPWGDAVNFDGPWSDEVRKFFIGNALHWFEAYHVDALRIDAVHGIFDFSARHLLDELREAVHSRFQDRAAYVIAESDLNDVRLITPPERGGYGLDAQWNDDFHHCVHTLLTGEDKGYYRDFGRLWQMAKAIGEGFVYSGQYSEFRKRRHGNSSAVRPPGQLVVFSQNHDQVGNRMLGDRLSTLVDLEKLKLAAGLVVLSPSIPLLFMGEEYGEPAPFQYFISHSDEALIEAVRKGRKEEFRDFQWEGEVPDPQDLATFERSKVNTDLSGQGVHRLILDYYKTLISVRKRFSAFRSPGRDEVKAHYSDGDGVVIYRLGTGAEAVLCAAGFNEAPARVKNPFGGRWSLVLDSSSPAWAGGGPGVFDNIHGLLTVNPYSFSLYRTES
ncbi:MAG: malto-oligosyltrehalose trehalohydrolase [Thermodesulfovibrionales bacterium]